MLMRKVIIIQLINQSHVIVHKKAKKTFTFVDY